MKYLVYIYISMAIDFYDDICSIQQKEINSFNVNIPYRNYHYPITRIYYFIFGNLFY